MSSFKLDLEIIKTNILSVCVCVCGGGGGGGGGVEGGMKDMVLDIILDEHLP